MSIAATDRHDVEDVSVEGCMRELVVSLMNKYRWFQQPYPLVKVSFRGLRTIVITPNTAVGTANPRYISQFIAGWI